MKKAPRLTGEQLAQAVALTFAYLGEVHGTYEGGGWIVVSGSGLEPHPDLKDKYPNGWTLHHRIRTTEARKRLVEACR